MNLKRFTVFALTIFFGIAPIIIPAQTGRITIALSPDGKLIGFTERSKEGSSIYSMNFDGSNLTRLFGGAKAMYPSWSPDGKKIVFTSGAAGGVFDIFVMNADGTNLTQLTKDAKQNWAAVFSPDGKRIAFNSTRQSGKAQIYMMNSDGSNQQPLMQDSTGNFYAPVWSPDGKQIAYYTYAGNKSQVMVMKADGSAPRRVADGTEPFWSKNGKEILFGTKLNSKDSSLYRIKLNGEDLKPVCNVSGYLGRLSVNGKSLVYVGVNAAENNGSKSDLYVLDMNKCRSTLLKS